MKILTVEDDAVAHLLLQAELKQLGHEIVPATDGEEGWAALADESIRLVISDWRMPRLDGLSLCRRIRAERGDYLCFLLLTEQSASDENIENAVQAGVDEFLSKPVNTHELRMRLHVAGRILAFTSEMREL